MTDPTEGIDDRSYRGYRRFRKALCQALLEYPDEENSTAVTPPVTPQSSEHTWSKFQKRNYCHYCKEHKEHKEEWMPQRPAKKRYFGTDITNIVTTATRRRGSSTWGGCSTCGVYLCVKGECWKLYHSQK
jgi:hypothetical protein